MRAISKAQDMDGKQRKNNDMEKRGRLTSRRWQDRRGGGKEAAPVFIPTRLGLAQLLRGPPPFQHRLTAGRQQIWPLQYLQSTRATPFGERRHGEADDGTRPAGLFSCPWKKKVCTLPLVSNLAAHVWSTKYRRKKKIITQFSCKSRHKSFEPN
jgi:hypothetical protein